MATRGRQDLIDEAAANLGLVQKATTIGTGTKTRAALISQVLYTVGVLGEGQTASADLINRVTSFIDPVVAQLSAEITVDITNTNAIPNLYFLQLAAIIAEAMKEVFGIVGDDLVTLVGKAKDARRSLRNLTRIVLIDRNLDQILADLAARDIVYLVDVTAIPDEWFIHLAWIVADGSKGKFELDPLIVDRATTEGARAIMMLREMTRGRPSFNTLRTCYM